MTSSTQVTDVEEARKPPDWRTADLQSIFGAPTFLEGEDASQYQALADHFRQAVEPRDFLEAMWIDEITKYTFESQRYRRAKTHLWRSSAYRGLEAVLGPLLEEGIVAHGVAQGWAQGDSSLVELVNKLFKSDGRSHDDVAAQTLVVILGDIERIEVLQASAEQRRNKALREIARHREALARQLRRISDEAIRTSKILKVFNANADAA